MNTLNENLRSFSIFIHIFNIFGIFKLKICAKRQEKFLSLFLIASFYIFYIICFLGGCLFLKHYTDKIVLYCQYLNHICSFFCISVIYMSEIIPSDSHIVVLRFLSQIDNLLIRNFKVKIDYRRKRIFNFLIATLYFTIMTFVTLLSPGDKNNIHAVLYDLYLVVPYLIWLMETFYTLLAYHIYTRFCLIKEILRTPKLFRHEIVIITEIFINTYKMMGAINNLFGMTVLAIFGKLLMKLIKN